MTAETGQKHTRTMLFGPVRTSRIGYRRYHAENLYPQDADLNWAVTHSYSAGVLKRVAGGLSSKEIGAALNISPRTVETHRASMMRKLDLHSVAELTRFAMEKGIIRKP